MKVCHVITGLNTGGAEVMMRKLIVATGGAGVTHSVISLIGPGPIGDELAAAGIRVDTLEMRRGSFTPAGMHRLVALIREQQPDVVQAWMYHANLLGGIAARLAGVRNVVWNIRAAQLEAKSEKRSSILIARASGRLARLLCRRIVTNSDEARRVHEAFGYPPRLFDVIPNGFDLDLFHPSEEARADVRAELGIAGDATLVGMIARFHPGKEHRTFLAAAGRLAAGRPDVHFLLAGDGVTSENPALAEPIREHQLEGRVHLLGRRADVPRLFAALDLSALTSAYEAFPNVLGEAMACAVPCVSTDVGDAAEIVGDTGVVVPVRDADALVTAWNRLLGESVEERRGRGARARERVRERYSLSAIASRYLALYRELMNEHDMVRRGRRRAARAAGIEG